MGRNINMCYKGKYISCEVGQGWDIIENEKVEPNIHIEVWDPQCPTTQLQEHWKPVTYSSGKYICGFFSEKFRWVKTCKHW